jgi:hypothetical protein
MSDRQIRKGKKKILVVSYYFSPINTIGSLRVSKLVKYLVHFGWEPWVLTVDNQLFKYTNDLNIEIEESKIIRADYGSIITKYLKRRQSIYSNESIEEISNSKSVRSRLFSLISGFFLENRFPDKYIPWYYPAYRKGKLLLENENFDVILSSFSPPASHIIAHRLSTKYNIPWVADFRDLWTQNHNNQRLGIFGYFFNQFEISLEKYIMSKAVSLVTVSFPLKQQLEKLHQKKVLVITNGYDHEDYEVNFKIKQEHNRRIQIVYTGNVYKGKQSPEILFLALDNLIQKKIINPDEFDIKFYGTNPDYVNLDFAKNFSDSIFFFPRISHRKTIEKQLSADILLLLQWNDNRVRGFYSGKIFEYLGARKPIFAVGVKGGVIAELLDETLAGILVSDVNEAESILEDWIIMHKKNGVIKYKGLQDRIQNYTRLKQAEQLSIILDEAAFGNPITSL